MSALEVIIIRNLYVHASLAIPFGSEADNYSPSSYGVETDDDLYHVGWTGSEIELEVRNQPSFERMGWVGPGPVS